MKTVGISRHALMFAVVLTLVLMATACGSTTPSQPADSLAETGQNTAAVGDAGQGSEEGDAESGAGGGSDTAGGSIGEDTGQTGEGGDPPPTQEAETGEAEPPQTGDGSGDRPDADERDRILDQVNQGPAIGGDPETGGDEEEAPPAGTESEQGNGEG